MERLEWMERLEEMERLEWTEHLDLQALQEVAEAVAEEEYLEYILRQTCCVQKLTQMDLLS
jgi:hypothetical protein